jgi:hypothetical protein
MIISRKRFMEEIAKAKQEVADQIHNERMINDRFSYVHRDIQNLFDRVSALEYKTSGKTERNPHEVDIRPIG